MIAAATALARTEPAATYIASLKALTNDRSMAVSILFPVSSLTPGDPDVARGVAYVRQAACPLHSLRARDILSLRKKSLPW
jgi:hypothetical protein